MAVKIKVENFQSIKKAELEVSGFTAVTGPNNSGKTALMRAVRGVFTNAGGTNFIRHGEKESIVNLKFDDGNSVEWRKGKKPEYTINGVGPLYPGRSIPEELSALGVNPIKVMGTEVWPSIAEQFTGQVFLLDQTGSYLAEAIADVERVTKLNAALRGASTDQRAAQAAIKIRKQDVTSLEEELSRYDSLPEVEKLVLAVEHTQVEVEKNKAHRNTLEDILERERAALENLNTLLPVEQIEVPVKPKGIDEEITLLSKLINLKTNADRLSIYIEKLSSLNSVNVPQRDSTLSEALQRLHALKALDVQKGRVLPALEALRAVESIRVPQAQPSSRSEHSSLEKMRILFSQRKRFLAEQDALSMGLSKVHIPDGGLSFTDLDKLKVLKDRFDKAEDQYVKLERALGQITIPQGRPSLDRLELLKGVAARYLRVKAEVTALAGIPQPKFNTKAERIEKAIEKLKDIYGRMSKSGQDLAGVAVLVEEGAQELASARQEVAQIIEQMPQCPTCGTNLEKHISC